MTDQPKCSICGLPMPLGEEMFKFHGYSTPCPRPPLPQQETPLKALVVEIFGFGEDKWFDYEDEFRELARKVAQAERERAARIAESCSPRHTECGNKIAAAIRRGGVPDAV